VPGEVGPKLGAVVGLDALDGHRQAAPHFPDEVRSRFDGVVRIDPKHPVPRGGFIDGGEPIEGTAAELGVLDIAWTDCPGTWISRRRRGPGRYCFKDTRGTRCRFKIRWIVGAET